MGVPHSLPFLETHIVNICPFRDKDTFEKSYGMSFELLIELEPIYSSLDGVHSLDSEAEKIKAIYDEALKMHPKSEAELFSVDVGKALVEACEVYLPQKQNIEGFLEMQL